MQEPTIDGKGPDTTDLRGLATVLAALEELEQYVSPGPRVRVVRIEVDVAGGVREGGARFKLGRRSKYAALRLIRAVTPA